MKPPLLYGQCKYILPFNIHNDIHLYFSRSCRGDLPLIALRYPGGWAPPPLEAMNFEKGSRKGRKTSKIRDPAPPPPELIPEYPSA